MKLGYQQGDVLASIRHHDTACQDILDALQLAKVRQGRSIK